MLPVFELEILDVVLDFALDALLAFYTSQGRSSYLVPLLFLITTEDQLSNYSEFFLLLRPLGFIADQGDLALQVLHK
jgi:hypothetical protein